jgi:hypothetical protein
MTVSDAQLRLDGLETPPLQLAPEPDANNGEVFTRRWVVELILDLSGYTADRDLAALVVLEPSCGTGAFLVQIVERLIESCRRHERPISDAINAVRGFDLMENHVVGARSAVAEVLIAAGVGHVECDRLTEKWIRQGDFLLTDHGNDVADFVIGNPPYVRLEDVPTERSAAYRRACPTMRGRSDIYVGFIEVGLRVLRSDGVLGFIVADRWMHNQYGANLRRYIANDYSVAAVVAMHDVNAFERPVSAYPAVTVIRRSPHRDPVIATTTEGFGPSEAEDLKDWASRSSERSTHEATYKAARLERWFTGDSLWPTGTPDQLALVADLERRFPSLEDPTTGTRVGIGVATGADKVFLTSNPDVVEEDRLLPLAMAADTTTGEVKWSGTCLINPWDGQHLVDLADYPRLRTHLEAHELEVRHRYVARRNHSRWFRTIDRINPALRTTPKLLLPDLKATIHPVLDSGEYYPHHNLYFVTSTEWPIEALGGLLLSNVANLFVGAYCVKMRGGCYRFQAQYLRRIRVPLASALSPEDLDQLADAFVQRDIAAATDAACRLYAITPDQHRLLINRRA